MQHREYRFSVSLLAAVALVACGSESGSDEAPQDAGPGGPADAGGADVVTDSHVGLDAETPDAGCLPPNKICDGKCVASSDPDYGCQPDTCEPCPQLAWAQMGCANNECVLVSCNAGHSDCDGDVTNGCETDPDTLDNCGACGATCAIPNAQESCKEGVCTIESCDEDWDDCNNNPVDGCETDLRDVANCGACGEVCEPNASCATGTCQTNG
ncbi:MAG: hypothetical protein CVU63_09645 [Deltaproteobacteria bacterium HGW-Deltaproteobacteria-20]|jgi:hypothetical protein|nr:MAG: hypothetical protein CVU63_09645 [Deltaproteobacteria bacterium HGW-Deltaproteobacteria-20]